ncbi:MAG: N-acetyl-gamma-glutamyl-phosphate reductase [Nitrosomonadales bacterium]|jgi:N-acetyl-gamma-glutamyl-phosphate reductase|nr:N-acetyl-gamma-glutamyl-phosphate reductase [Nitrosomonadales bacterium]MBT3918319.1 N-acetyl-gamma-glutamyl-phosphate reductase [Nitrosomonadales bacterium]MBT4182741.1 N-acetyl-gamma-glutamyl-phosphate reductase [Nitrosomonadales bacterium]MBT4571590.1 N-acetyl-gamma-glutamyl-phosphate reductase [Nitrosomonadales bacterium]MBT4759362.1 N-acetyl-gamma-glutamyl-phosphate reductase [Nitrosomonadales bacterium]
MKKNLRVSIFGGTGYTGVELIRLLLSHPYVEIYQITSRKDKGKRVDEIYPSFRGILDNLFVSPEDADLKNVDLVFFATPNGIAMNYADDLISKGKKVIDLAADFRIKDKSVWEKWYGMRHKSPNLIDEAVYGLPEINRDSIKKSQLIANPGCYPTAIQLALIPLLEKKLINPSNIIADAKSGISGAGKNPELKLLMSEAEEDFKAYGIGGHRHLPEIEENLTKVCGENVTLTFVPHLVPMVRGIFATLYVECIKDFKAQDIFNSFYVNEPFVDIMNADVCPNTKSVRASNFCRISFHKEENSNRLIIFSVIDNLMKGAAGQAIQNMNIMMDYPETSGISHIPINP